MVSLFFLLLALVLFIVAALGVASGKINLLAAGLAAWVASALVAQWVK